MVDAHGSLEVVTAIRLAQELTPYNIAWFEEPVSPDDHRGQAEVRRTTTIPIASGEREFTRFDFQDLLDHHALDIAQPDVARAGGFTEIRRIAALTSARGIRLAPHAWGSGVLFAASIHTAMAAPNCHILEVSQGYMPMMWELFNEPFDIRPDGTVHAPDRPGLGFTLRQDARNGSSMLMAQSTPSERRDSSRFGIGQTIRSRAPHVELGLRSVEFPEKAQRREWLRIEFDAQIDQRKGLLVHHEEGG